VLFKYILHQLLTRTTRSLLRNVRFTLARNCCENCFQSSLSLSQAYLPNNLFKGN